MTGCRRVRGMLAASLYEALPPDEAGALEKHLAACPACRAEQAALRCLTADIPTDIPAFQGDLMPALRGAMRERRLRRRWALGTSVAAALVLVLAGATVLPRRSPTPTAPVAPVALATALDDALATGAALEDDGQAAAARDALREALDTAPEDAAAGVAWLALARLEYDLGHYGEAMDAYETVRAAHPEAWRDSDRAAKTRFELLADTRAEDFAPLVGLERARRMGEAAFPDLERLLARRPESVVAREALATLCALVRPEADDAAIVARLRDVRERCTDPTALARVDLEMGHAYWRDLNDLTSAREHFSVAATAENAVLARLASEALNALETSGP